ncbi:FagA protein [Pseudomonas sp. KNUC1026]|uniref:FagA protein n=1 Tax=Pseudomonas sp. KNUC1026 TaxID=2893890 RepID=UPI001F3C5373|nr:FagA protein [Pseudomonas sp. KNUC1026]UFH50164.1 FagA protein [Pseudomonas sp. KNUC1026]
MSSAVRELPYLDHWRWLGQQIRCALRPDEPRLIDHYFGAGRCLARFTPMGPHAVALTTFRLLLDTAQDVALPWHWRNQCLDQAWRPLRELHGLAQSCRALEQWQSHAQALAHCELHPSISYQEPPQGYSDEHYPHRA